MAVCSAVHDMINIGRLLSECFSQDSPRKRMSREQVNYYVKGLILFENYKTSLCNSQSTNWEAAASWAVLLSHVTSCHGIVRSHAIVPLAMGISCTEISAYENHFSEHIQLVLIHSGKAATVQHAICVFKKNVSNEVYFLCTSI